jgi:hypothetical protein
LIFLITPKAFQITTLSILPDNKAKYKPFAPKDFGYKWSGGRNIFRPPAKESKIGILLSFEASISCKMAFSQAKKLILRPEIDRGALSALLGDVHAPPADFDEGAAALEKYALWHIFSGGRAGRPWAAMPGGPFILPREFST